jgi:hypothetical protein
MEASNNVKFELSKDEALVLFEFLARFNKEPRANVFEHQAEERVLWSLEALLERQLVEPFDPQYVTHLQEARDRVRDSE